MVLEVDGILRAYSAAGAYFYVFPRVNGVGLNPLDLSAAVSCAAAVDCTATGTWWLDLDAAEAAHPGSFIGKPLNVDLLGQNVSGPGYFGYAGLRARLVKK